jgi:uncharacterized protein
MGADFAMRFDFIFYIYVMQEMFIFFPEKLSPSHVFDFYNDFEELDFETEPNVIINGLLFKTDSSKGVILHFHGNTGSIRTWGFIAENFTRNGYDVLIIDYRGYGKSTGSISNEQQFHKDSTYIYQWLIKRYPESNIIIHGRSFGTGIAVKLASENNPRMLILETPYLRFSELSRYHYPYLELFFSLKYQFRTDLYITKVSCPVYLFHGDCDEIVPYSASLRLSKLSENIKLFIMEGATHNSLHSLDEYHIQLEKLLK